jgi:hypothetical protein
MFKKSSKQKIKFQPFNISNVDDATHLKENFSHVETWYFDGYFEDEYSMVVLINVLHINGIGFVLTGLFLYKDTKPIKIIRQRYPLNAFFGSTENPIIKIDDKTIINYLGSDKKTGYWSYNISMGDTIDGVDLLFVQKNRSWKGKTLLGDWLVVPLFDVTGSMFVDGKKLDVTGVGYHDHNIYPLYTPFFIKGYHFGKIPLGKFNITWANVMSRKGIDQPIVVINKDDTYISVDPCNIKLTVEKEIENNRKKIPEVFNIYVNTDDIYLSVKSQMKNIHNIHIPSLNYWRYHIHYSGKLSIDSETTNIDLIDISELLKFL